MNRLWIAAVLGLFTATGAYAQQQGTTPQQQRMKDCNVQASKQNLKGDERRSYMSSCLKGDKPQLTAQQEKMKSCNRDAGDQKLKGDERKKFMSQCLKG
jgi:psiF repeat-containing protein